MELFFHFLFQIVQLNAVLAVGCSVSYSILCLGHFYFTMLLLPNLLATAKISPDGNVRIVKISFMGHMFCSGIDFNTFKEGPVRKKKGLQFCMAKANRFVFFPRPYINIHVISGKYPCINEFAHRYTSGSQGIASTPEIFKRTQSEHELISVSHDSKSISHSPYSHSVVNGLRFRLRSYCHLCLALWLSCGLVHHLKEQSWTGSYI